MARMIKEMVVQDCPIRNVLARVCDKWSLLVIYTLKNHQDGPLRFNALRKLIPDISYFCSLLQNIAEFCRIL